MLRAVIKAFAMWPVGRLPRGPELYHGFTCGVLGSQRFHPRKLAGVWPRYATLLGATCGLDLDRTAIWVHECGWTPFAALASYMITGRAAVLSNSHARVLDRYLSLSVECALAMDLPADLARSPRVAARRSMLEQLARSGHAVAVIEALGGQVLDGVAPAALPLPSASIDFCHSGNALEHYRPDDLRAFVSECHRVLRPGGVSSHVFDHRDHLHHVDRGWPFLLHRALPDRPYRWLFGHPLLYHNRLGPDDVMGLFEDAGFERILVRRAGVDFRYAPDDHVLRQPAGLPAWACDRVPGLSELDLRTAYGHYVYRKPMIAAPGELARTP